MNGARLWGIYKQWDTLQLLKNEIRSAAAKWMELWDMMLSEINQTQREEWEGKRFSNKKKNRASWDGSSVATDMHR